MVESVESGPELLRALLERRPDVAVVDVRLPPTFTDDGLRAAVVDKFTSSILAKLDLPLSEDDNRRVRAVLAYLNA